MSTKPGIGLSAGTSTRPSRAARRDEAAKVLPEPASSASTVGREVSEVDAAAHPGKEATVSQMFESKKRRKKPPLNTYITQKTNARLEWLVRKHDLKTTDVTERALSDLLDALGVPEADDDGHFNS